MCALTSLVLLASTATQSTPAEWFDACVRGHVNLKSAHMTAEVRQTLSKQLTRTTYELTYVRPNQIKLRAREPEQNSRAASDRTFCLRNDDFTAYDAVVHERLQRKAVPIGSLVDRFSVLVGKTDDVLVALLEPDRLEKFLVPFRNAKDWKIANSGGITSLSRQSGTGKNRNMTTFRFDTSSKRLRGMRIGIPDGTLVWDISYGPSPKSINWRPPADAPLVPSFTLRPASANYATANARKIAERSITAYDRLRHAVFTIDGSTGRTQAWVSGGRVREETAGYTYIWGKGAGALVDRAKRTYFSGKAGLPGMIEYLARAGTRMDPVVRQIMTRNNPIRVLLTPGVRVTFIGELSIAGAQGNALRFQNSNAIVTMVLRKDNGLLASVETQILDPEQRVVMTTQRSFYYGSVGKAVEPVLFQLSAPTGYRRAPLSSLPK